MNKMFTETLYICVFIDIMFPNIVTRSFLLTYGTRDALEMRRQITKTGA